MNNYKKSKHCISCFKRIIELQNYDWCFAGISNGGSCVPICSNCVYNILPQKLQYKREKYNLYNMMDIDQITIRETIDVFPPK